MARARTMNPGAAKVSNPFVDEIERLINACDHRTQADIAYDIGYANANLITMFKRGITRVPDDKVVPLAKAIGADPARLLRLWAQSYTPGLLEAFETLSGGGMLSKQEQSWIKGVERQHHGQLRDQRRRGGLTARTCGGT